MIKLEASYDQAQTMVNKLWSANFGRITCLGRATMNHELK